MATDLSVLKNRVTELLGESLVSAEIRLGELTVVVKAADMQTAMLCLRDQAGFEQLIDLCGVDYSEYGEGAWDGARFAVVYHLLSVVNNVRVRVRIFAGDDEFPVLESVTKIWPCAGWFEREAFDLFGVVFNGHPDLRRIMTDYGFVG
jgi:NADH-quinone oxidoreductase subunit C